MILIRTSFNLIIKYKFTEKQYYYWLRDKIETGTLINTNKTHKSLLKELSLYIYHVNVNQKIRIRFYSFNEEHNEPDTIINPSDIIVSVKKYGWSKFDLSKLGIILPKKMRLCHYKLLEIIQNK